MASLSRVVAALVCAAGSSVCFAQMDRFIQDVAPTYDGGFTMRSSYGITACSDGGAAIIGDGINLIRLKNTGVVAWELHYSDLPNASYGGQGHSVVETADGGFAISAIPQHADPRLASYRFGILSVDASGGYRWGYITTATNNIDPVFYKQWDATRVRELPDRSIIATGVNQYQLENNCIPESTDFYDVGVLFKVGRDGRSAFAYEYGESGAGRRSHVAFTDVAVGERGIVAIGTIRGARECEPCSVDVDGLLVWMDFDGNVIASWSFDSPNDLPGNEVCEVVNSTEWGAGIAMSGDAVFFSLATRMAYSASGDALVGRFDLSSGLVWSGRIKEHWPMYHCVDIQNPSKNILFAGHRKLPTGETASLHILKPDSGNWVSSRWYQDPRPYASALYTFRGLAPVKEDLTWLVNGPTFGGPGEVYFMQVDAAGDSKCSWVPDAAEPNEPLNVKRRDIRIVGRLPVKEWRPVPQKVNSESVDPCR